MTTKEKIQKAMEMINDFDFSWRMCDYAYTNGVAHQAKQKMKEFANYIHTECSNAETTLRQLSISNYKGDRQEIERLKNLLPTI